MGSHINRTPRAGGNRLPGHKKTTPWNPAGSADVYFIPIQIVASARHFADGGEAGNAKFEKNSLDTDHLARRSRNRRKYQPRINTN
jgi:hypothetical protein